MSNRLSIGVVIPTLNVRERLPAHLTQLLSWADLVQEIIVVDSHSSDGSIEMIQQRVRHPRLHILQHPPGLYQSWNHAIGQVTAEYTYISTVGDTISREGLQHLAAAATELRSDVLVSRPEFFSKDGQRLTRKHWPVHRLLESRPLIQPIRVAPPHAFLLATLDAPEGSLGSSASNLYRTAVLQRFPFPTNYGHLGDTAWGIRHAFQTVLAVTPQVFSRFVIHPSGSNISDDDMEELVDRLFCLARQTVDEAKSQLRTVSNLAPALTVLRDLPVEFKKLRRCQEQYDDARKQKIPWICNPSAWKRRLERNRQRSVVRQIKQLILQQLG